MPFHLLQCKSKALEIEHDPDAAMVCATGWQVALPARPFDGAQHIQATYKHGEMPHTKVCHWLTQLSLVCSYQQ